MSDDTHFTLGTHEADIRTVKQELHAVREELVAIRVLLAETKGGVRMLLAVGSIGGAIGAALVKALAYVKGGA
jgi:hypothetical protein